LRLFSRFNRLPPLPTILLPIRRVDGGRTLLPYFAPATLAALFLEMQRTRVGPREKVSRAA